MRSPRIRTIVGATAVAAALAWVASGVSRVDRQREFAIVVGAVTTGSRLVTTDTTWFPRGWSRLRRFPVDPVTGPLPGPDDARLSAGDGSRFGLVGSLTYRYPVEGREALARFLEGAPGADPIRASVLEAARPLARVRDGRASFAASAREFERSLRDLLATRGILLEGITLESIESLRVAEGEVVPPTDRKLLVVGLDGADWRILDPLIESGRVPNLAGLVRRGARARLLSLSPMISPVVWTTIATGVEPERHGVLDFLAPAGTPRAGEPVTSAQRLVPTVWEMLGDRGVPVGIVGWWGTWPADAVNGYLVSDRVAYQLFGLGEDKAPASQRAWPPGVLDDPGRRVVAPALIDWSRIAAFLGGSRRVPEDFAPPDRERLDGLRTVLASGDTYVDLALSLRREFRPRFEAVYLEGTDTVGHLFMRFRPPPLEGVAADEIATYGGVVDRYYEAADGYIGRLLETYGDDWTIMIVSDHGFANDDTRPLTTDSRIGHGAAADWHRRFGVLILAGRDIVPGTTIEEATVYDVAPTILALYGQPVPESWRGRVLGRAIDPAFFERHPVLLGADDPVLDPERLRARGAGEDVDADELREKLTALGYLAPAGLPAAPGVDAVSTANNRGVALIARGSYEEAARGLEEALRSSPGHPMLTANLGIALRLAGRPSEALPLLERAFGSPATRVAAGIQLAQIRLERREYAEAERLLRAVLADEPGSADARNALGIVLEKRGDAAGASREYDAAARLDGAAAEPRNNLGNLAKRRGDFDEAERWYSRAIEADPFFMGAYNNLALIYQDRGEIGRAIELYENARAKAPGNAVVLNNLGSLHFSIGDKDEARRLWERAVELDPAYASPLNNLAGIALTEGRGDDGEELLARALAIDPAYGDALINMALLERSRGRPESARDLLRRASEDRLARMTALFHLATLETEEGRFPEAAGALATLRREAPAQPQVLNMIADGWRRIGRPDEAIECWRASLRLEPEQEEVERALRSLEAGR